MASAQARQQLPLRTPSSAWGTACPPLCAVRGAPDDVLLGPGPSLQILRRRLPALVRTLRGYYGPVRLLGGVRVGRAACAFPHRPATSRQAPPRSPGSRAGSFLTCTGSPTAPGSPAACDSATVDMAFPFCPQGRHPNLGISRLNRRPASASVNASPAMSPSPAHDSRSAWFATPSLWGSFIPYSPPVYPGAFGQTPSEADPARHASSGPAWARDPLSCDRHSTPAGDTTEADESRRETTVRAGTLRMTGRLAGL